MPTATRIWTVMTRYWLVSALEGPQGVGVSMEDICFAS